MKQFAAMAVGGGVFALSYVALSLPLVLSTLAAGGAYGAGLFLFNTLKEQGSTVPPNGVDAATIRQTLSDAAAKVDGIEAMTRRIKKQEVRSKLEKLVALARGILDDIRRDPKDIFRARQFLKYYLDSVTRILTHYTYLTDRGIESGEAREALEKVESALLLLEGAFEKQRESLALDNIVDLDSEIRVLKTTIQVGGTKE